MTKRSLPALAVPLLLLLLVAGACSASSRGGGSGDSGGSGGSLSAPAADKASGSGSGAASGGETDAVTGTASARTPGQSAKAAVDPLTRAVVSTGQVTLHSRTVASARGEVLRLVASWGGTVADEQTQSDRHGRMTDSTMTLRVPSARFDAAMAGLARIGEVEQQSRSSQDVTTRVIDNRARVRAAERSIESIERLLARATRLSDVIAIESDLARRQADLDSLEQQQAWLADQTSLSTITVHLSRTMPSPAPRHEARGFLAGLDHGWSALRSASVGALTVVGAVLPFGAVVLLVGWPAWLVVRRRRPVAPPPAQA